MNNRKSSPRFAALLLALVLGACGGGGGDAGGGTGGGQPNGVVLLPHQALAFDASRGVYYATVGAQDLARGERIATIDRRGTITALSDRVGNWPTEIAVSKDGSRLYVGIRGTGEIAQYALPGFNLLAKLSLPTHPTSGATYAEHMAVSPTDPNTLVVSLAYTLISPRHAGVALVKNMVLLPDRTRDHTGGNRLVFSATGDAVYSFDNASTEHGLRKLVPTASGIAQQSMVSVTGARFSWDLDAFGNVVMVGNRAFNPVTMTEIGAVTGASFHCVGVSSATKMACFSTDYGRVVVADTRNFTPLSQLNFPETPETASYKLVAGPAGQVAASASESNRIYLIDDDILR